MLWLTRRVASFLTDNQAGIRSFPGPRFRVVLAQSGGKWDQPENLTDQTGLRIIALCRHSGDPASLAMVALASSGNRIPGKSRREDLRRDHRADVAKKLDNSTKMRAHRQESFVYYKL